MPDRFALRVFDMAAEPDVEACIGTFEFPGMALQEPGLGRLDLPSALEALAEEAVLIADTVAIGRAAQRRQAFEEARRQPSEAAIAEGGVRLVREHRVVILAKLRQRVARLIHEAEIDDAVFQKPPDEKLHRQVIDPLCAFAPGHARGLEPAVGDMVANREGQRHAPILGSGIFRLAPEAVAQVPHDRVTQHMGRGLGRGSRCSFRTLLLSQTPLKARSRTIGKTPGRPRAQSVSRPRSAAYFGAIMRRGGAAP